MRKTQLNIPLQKQEALERLFAENSSNRAREDCFDGFGNYRYATDMIVDTPNIAIGSSEGGAYQSALVLSAKPFTLMSDFLP